MPVNEKNFITIRPGFSGFTAIAILFFLIHGTGGIVLMLQKQWISGAFLIIVGCSLLFLNFRYRIRLSNHEIVYRGAVFTKKVKFSDIDKFEIQVIDWTKAKNRTKPLVVLSIWSVALTEPVMEINIRFFSIRDLKYLADRLRQATGATQKLIIPTLSRQKIEI